MRPELQKKVDRAIKLIQSAGKDGQVVEVAYSGGKDSDVILELVKMSGINYRAIYKNTTIDPPGTIKHVKEMGVEIVRPRMTFREILSNHGMPSRFRRFCCTYLKEYKILDRAIIGIRREESNKRAERYKEPEVCRVFNKKEKCRQYLPILDWTLQNVSEFLKERDIKCAPVYYDEDGNFHAERRLGCMGCPMASRKQRLAEFKKYPNMVKMYIRGGGKWLENHKLTKTYKKFDGNTYKLFVRMVFFDTDAEFEDAIINGMFGEVDCKAYLEDYFNIKL